MKAIAALLIMIVFAVGCTNPEVPKNNGIESFSSDSNDDGMVDTTQPSYDYIDLGLPSGTLWATFNVGANVPEEYGDFFAWGETAPKATYSWSNYKHCDFSEGEGWNAQTKYCNNSFFGYNGFTDQLTVLQSDDDAATVNWGNDWCMPTVDQWQELVENTECVWEPRNGVDGRLFTAQNGASLFLPAAGFRWDDEIHYTGNGCGNYWSSSLSTEKSGATDDPNVAFNLRFYSGDNLDVLTEYRGSGLSVRPVRSVSQD